MRPVVPGHADGGYLPDNGIAGNVMLRIGEVQNIWYPEDKQNVNGRFIEYQVYVAHKANGTAVMKMYDHVIAIDNFAGIADYSFVTYRADPSATGAQGGNKRPTAGKGARVIMLCVNGESQNAVILGGIRNAAAEKDANDTKEDGHHLISVFNGVEFNVNKDGELIVTYNGATALDGSPADGTDTDAAGTYVKIDKSGNMTLSDRDGNNQIVIDRVNGKVNTTAASEVNLIAPTVRVGDDSTTDPMVGGNELVQIMMELLTAIETITVLTIVGPSTPPVNVPAFEAIRGQLQTLLSKTAFVKM